MRDTTVRYRLFHLIKDVSETVETKKIRRNDVYFTVNTIIRRSIFKGKLSWILSVSDLSYTEAKIKK